MANREQPDCALPKWLQDLRRSCRARESPPPPPHLRHLHRPPGRPGPAVAQGRLHAGRPPAQPARCQHPVSLQGVCDGLQRHTGGPHVLNPLRQPRDVGDGWAGHWPALRFERRQALARTGADGLPLPLGDRGDTVAIIRPAGVEVSIPRSSAPRCAWHRVNHSRRPARLITDLLRRSSRETISPSALPAAMSLGPWTPGRARS